MSSNKQEASPVKSLTAEIGTFRALFKATLDGHAARMDRDLDTILEKVGALGDADKISAGKLRDIRDMLTLLRHLDVKPDKGRRKDLKKLDSVADDLAMLIENW